MANVGEHRVGRGCVIARCTGQGEGEEGMRRRYGEYALPIGSTRYSLRRAV